MSLLQQQRQCLWCCHAMGGIPQNGICRKRAMSVPEIPLEKKRTAAKWSVKIISEVRKTIYKMTKNVIFSS